MSKQLNPLMNKVSPFKYRPDDNITNEVLGLNEAAFRQSPEWMKMSNSEFVDYINKPVSEMWQHQR